MVTGRMTHSEVQNWAMKILDVSEILKEITTHTKIRREFGCFVDLNQEKTYDRMELLLDLRSCKHTGSLPLSHKSCKNFLKIILLLDTLCVVSVWQTLFVYNQ